MGEEYTFYVCLGNSYPVKVQGDKIPASGDRFEFRGKVVEVIDIHHGKGGTQLQTIEV